MVSVEFSIYYSHLETIIVIGTSSSQVAICSRGHPTWTTSVWTVPRVPHAWRWFFHPCNKDNETLGFNGIHPGNMDIYKDLLLYFDMLTQQNIQIESDQWTQQKNHPSYKEILEMNGPFFITTAILRKTSIAGDLGPPHLDYSYPGSATNYGNKVDSIQSGNIICIHMLGKKTHVTNCQKIQKQQSRNNHVPQAYKLNELW